MRFEKLDNWDPNFRHAGILYFAQRIQEMLFHYTSHVYKRPVLNTYLLAEEYINNARLVENGSINENHLKYIMEEFQESFNNDIVIQNRLDSDTRNQILQELNSATDENKKKIMEYVLYILRNYDYWCKEYIQEIVLQEREKKKIERALRVYIPGLIGAGYSPEYIYHYNQEIFFKKRVDSENVLENFLNRFDFKENEYTVYLP